jgi:tetratricopeptide (TPR) repeat protein/transcriptional regulator with XRE-family HTH domain
LFSGVVRTHRQRLGLTQEELADRSGLSVRAIGKIESGRTTPRPQTVRLLADVFGLTGAERERFIRCAAGEAGPAVSVPGPAVPTAVPAQLPADVSEFLGREVQLGWLDEVVAGPRSGLTAVVVSAVAGAAGVGKTALTVHWAHRVRDRFPDGQLYVNLRGYDPDQPMSAGEALVGFLSALGVAGSDIPFDLDDRAARFRTEVADRRMLIVLDNAATVEQVRPLLPGSPTCVVVVTSRDSLAGLVVVEGARRLDLDLLPPVEAIALLRRLIGGRVDAEPEAARELARCCAGLPLALRIAAELVVSSPTRSLGELVAELADQRRRLDVLDVGGDPRAAVSTVFSWSLRHLPPSVVRAFGLLGHHPGPDLDAYAAAALVGTSVKEARGTLDRLAQAHLAHRVGRDRYGMHDLLRAYASGLGADRPGEAGAGVGRLLDYYLATTVAAMSTLYPVEAARMPAVPAGVHGPDLADANAANRWLRAELAALVMAVRYAATHDRPDCAIALPVALNRFLSVGGYHVDALTMQTHALEVARSIGDRNAEAKALMGMGGAHMSMGNAERCAALFEESLALAERNGDRVGQARAFNSLAINDWQQARFERSFERFARALDLYRAIGDPTGIPAALTNLANVETRLGRYEAAVEHLTESMDFCRQLGNDNGVAQALNSLGYLEVELRRYDEAAAHLEQAVDLCRQTGRRSGEASALDSLGAAYSGLGRHERARDVQQQALAITRELGERVLENWVLNGLGTSALAAGRLADALEHHSAALALATEIGARDHQANAHAGLARAHERAGDLGVARDEYATALAIYEELGLPEATRVRDRLTALDDQTSAPRSR